MDVRFKYLKLPFFVLTLLLVAACSPGTEVVPTATPQPVPTEAPVVEDTPVPTDEAVEPPAVEDEASVEVVPTPRQGLVATDPTTVDLASGEPTLVEFFAFW